MTQHYPRLIADLECRPGPGRHIVRQFLLPGEFRVRLEVTGGAEMQPARVARCRRERHALGHGGVGYLVLHRSGDAVTRLPRLRPARREIDVAAERALIRV